MKEALKNGHATNNEGHVAAKTPVSKEKVMKEATKNEDVANDDGHAAKAASHDRTEVVHLAPERPVTLPTISAPSTPTGWEAPPARVIRRRQKPTSQQESVASAMAEELASAGTYTADLGQRAPRKEEVLAALRAGLAWSLEEQRATRWLSYAKDQKTQAWDQLMRLSVRLGRALTLAVQDEARLGESYRSSQNFLRGRSDVARRSAVTRKTRAKKGKDPVK